MTNLEKNRLYMLQSVIGTLEEYRAEWAEAPQMENLYQELQSYERQTLALFALKMELKVPHSPVKETHWQDFVKLVGQVTGLLKLHAFRAKDDALVNRLHFSESTLLKSSSQTVLTYAHAIKVMVEEHEEALTALAEDPTIFERFKEATDGFIEQALAPSKRRRRLGETSEKIQVVQLEAGEFLSQVGDSLMLFYREKNPDFYRAWQNARVRPKFRGASRKNEPSAEMGQEQEDQSVEAFGPTRVRENAPPAQNRKGKDSNAA